MINKINHLMINNYVHTYEEGVYAYCHHDNVIGQEGVLDCSNHKVLIIVIT